MSLGYFAVGLAAQRAAPRASLATCCFAAQFLDWLWPTFLVLDFVTHRPDLPLGFGASARVGLELRAPRRGTLPVARASA